MTKKRKIFAGIRVCSKTKNPNILPGEPTLLKNLYVNTNIKGFFRKMKELDMIYFVLSRKFGICSEGKHNTAYSSAEHLGDYELKRLLKSQAPKYSDFSLIYYNHRPLTHTKWVNMLREAGFIVSEVRKVAEFSQYSQDNNLDQYLQKSTSVNSVEAK
jgi:hypothetical protein